MAIQIFISYRRDGGEFLALHMYEILSKAGYEVFYDIESLRSGKFNKKIFAKIEECIDFILILPEHGLDRCVDPEDWVRLEVEHAIQCNKNIIPLMMRNFTWPNNLPASLRDLPNYNGITASSELFEGVVIALEKRFLQSKKRKEMPSQAVKTVEQQDEYSRIEKKLDEGLFDEAKEYIGNPEVNPRFKGASDSEKGRLYKYLLWAERGMRWSDDPHKMLVEPFYGPNYNTACRYGYKEELESINRSILKNIHDFVEMKVDLNNKGPYMIDDPAQCGGDYRYLWECILFQTNNLTCFTIDISLPNEIGSRIKIIASFIDEFRSVCPKWIYKNGSEGLTQSKRFQEFIIRFDRYTKERNDDYLVTDQ